MQVIMMTLGSLCFLFGLYNVYNFLYRMKKYKQRTYQLIYVAALLCLALNMAFSMIVAFDDYCFIGWFITSYGAAYCNVIVGTCQAYMLSTLKS